ncbi:MAG: hypothetical protein WC300_03100 [Candidatus Omnitrophota bacterium]|jgi:hypothetical protein
MEEKNEAKVQKADEAKQSSPGGSMVSQAPAKPEAVSESAGPKQEEGVKKNKKMNLMSLKEIDAKMKDVQEKMGGLKSRYAKQLLKQKELLGGSAEIR